MPKSLKSSKLLEDFNLCIYKLMLESQVTWAHVSLCIGQHMTNSISTEKKVGKQMAGAPAILQKPKHFITLVCYHLLVTKK